MENDGYVYILTSNNHSVLYTGVTTYLKKRIWQHKNNQSSKFTNKYNVHILVYFEKHDNIESAIEREKQIKNLVRRKKVELIDKFNPKWEDLYDKLV